eukprot:g2686.t1
MSSKKGKARKQNQSNMEKTRIAVVTEDRCKPKKCNLECKKGCPVNQQLKNCIEVNKKDKIAKISEILCIGCNICVKKCPFDAIDIIQLPKSLNTETTHRYGPNSFKLHRLPTPRPGQVLGLVGTNGIGKSTAMKILAAKLKPNLGDFDDAPTWEGIIKYFRGSELQNYFLRMLEEKIKAIIKPQYVDAIPRALARQAARKAAASKGKTKKKSAASIMAAAAGASSTSAKKTSKSKSKKLSAEDMQFPTVRVAMKGRDERGKYETILDELTLRHVQNRDVDKLSGGELQRFAIACVILQNYQMYMFDEPSSFLDVKQRLKAAYVIRSILDKTSGRSDAELANTYVICVEHDLAVLDYLSDFICVLYGKPGGYGVVSNPFSVRDGINVFLAGYNPNENMRFRNESLDFKIKAGASSGDTSSSKKKKKKGGDSLAEEDEEEVEKKSKKGKKGWSLGTYPSMTKSLISKKKQSTFTLNVEAGDFNESEIIVLLGENGAGKTTFIRMMSGKMKSDEQMKAEAEGDEDAERFGVPRLAVSAKPQTLTAKYKGTVQQLLYLKIKSAMTHAGFQSEVVKPLSIEPLMDKKVLFLSGGELQRVAICLTLGMKADIYLIDEPSAYLDSEQRIRCAKVIRRFIKNAKKTAYVVEHDFIMATYLADRPNSMKDQEQKAAGAYFFMDTDE